MGGEAVGAAGLVDFRGGEEFSVEVGGEVDEVWGESVGFCPFMVYEDPDCCC